MARLLAIAALPAALAVTAALQAPSAHAACLSGSFLADGTDCATFAAGQSATAKVAYIDANLNSNGFWQIGFTTNLGSAITLSNLKWSATENGTYQQLLTGSFTSGTNSNYSYSAIQSVNSASSPVPVGANNQFWVQYDIPSSLAVGDTVQVQLRSNSTGNDTAGVLDATGGASVVIGRTNTAVSSTPFSSPVPGPLPLFGAAASFAISRRLRQRIRTTI